MRILLSIITAILLLASCVKGDDATNTHRNNFEALWRIIDERYCFLPYKQAELGLDWDEVHSRYAARVKEDMSTINFFNLMAEMLSELKDGHVNLVSNFEYAHNWSYYEDYPRNYNDSIIDASYLGTDYHIAGGLRYCILPDEIGYIRVPTFSTGISMSNVSNTLFRLDECHSIIIDVRSNGGGSIESARNLASHFIDAPTLVGYEQHKTGPGRNDFSTPEEVWLNPSNGLRWLCPVVVLTNRSCFSATNDFVKCMKCAPNAIIMGDRTGGGSGMPMNSELPNGWAVRYSAVIYYDRNMQHTEFGIAPDRELTMSGADTDRNLDSYIEQARAYLNELKAELDRKLNIPAPGQVIVN